MTKRMKRQIGIVDEKRMKCQIGIASDSHPHGDQQLVGYSDIIGTVPGRQ